MQYKLLLTGLLASLTTLVSAQTSTIAPPSQDPFYTQPTNIATYPLGAIVRSRDVTNDFKGLSESGVTLNAKSVYQFMYRSNDSLATPVADVMTFFTPNNGNSSRLLAYETAYDSANNDCSPSYSLRTGASSVAGDIVLIAQALRNGWYVTTSDYEGLKAEFVAGIQSGHGVLDSIRASLTSQARALTGLSANAQYAMFGYSGGSIGAEWAAEMALTYARDLPNFVGTAVGGLPANISNVLLTVNNKFTSGLAFTGSHGIALAYPNASDYLNSQLKPSKKADYNTYATTCGSSAGANMNFFDYFTSGMAILYSKVIQTVLSGGGQMGVHGIPKMPLYVYKGFFDEISPVQDTTDVVQKYCANGGRVTYEINYLTGHFTEAIIGTPAAFQYISDRFNGVAVPSSCVYEYVNISKVVSAGDAVASDVVSALTNVLDNLGKNFAASNGSSNGTAW